MFVTQLSRDTWLQDTGCLPLRKQEIHRKVGVSAVLIKRLPVSKAPPGARPGLAHFGSRLSCSEFLTTRHAPAAAL